VESVSKIGRLVDMLRLKTQGTGFDIHTRMTEISKIPEFMKIKLEVITPFNVARVFH
jgi:hypothetical protein